MVVSVVCRIFNRFRQRSGKTDSKDIKVMPDLHQEIKAFFNCSSSPPLIFRLEIKFWQIVNSETTAAELIVPSPLQS